MGQPEPDLDLLRQAVPTTQPDWRMAGAGSVAAHVLVIGFLLSWHGEPVVTPEEPPVQHIITKLYIPPELTQKAPNKGPISKEIVAESIAPRPVIRTPAPAPAARASSQPPPAPPSPPQRPPERPPQQQVRATPQPTVPDPPKIDAQAPTGQNPLAQVTPQPTIEKPKLVLENAAPPPRAANAPKPTGSLVPQTNSVQDAIRDLSRGSSRTGMAVGDIGADLGSIGPGLNLPPSAGRPRSSLELKSDPMGVDFRPYLLQALAAVRRNWFAVYPEAARLGQRGQVVLQFAIIRQGSVTKVIYTTESGSRALDQAAVAAVSASNPLPPLPAEFKGDRIVLQMTFLYNMPR